MLTSEQIREIRAALTLGDIQIAKEATKDDQEMAQRAMHRRAHKLGYINGETFADFLDEVRVEDLRLAFAAESAGPLGTVPPISLPSADSGE